MPRIRRPKIPFNYEAIDPVEASRQPGAIPKDDYINIAGSLPALTPIGHRRWIELAERFMPQENFEEAMRITTPWIKADPEGKLIPAEAEWLQIAIMSIFGMADAFKKLRKQFKIPLQEIAEECNVKHSTVLRWENGQASIPPHAISILCRIAGERTMQTPLTGNDIDYLIKKWQLTQSELAKIIGVSPLTVFNWKKRGALPLPKSAYDKVWEKVIAKYPDEDFGKAAA